MQNKLTACVTDHLRGKSNWVKTLLFICSFLASCATTGKIRCYSCLCIIRGLDTFIAHFLLYGAMNQFLTCIEHILLSSLIFTFTFLLLVSSPTLLVFHINPEQDTHIWLLLLFPFSTSDLHRSTCSHPRAETNPFLNKGLLFCSFHD